MTQLATGGEHPLMFIGKVEEQCGIRPNFGDQPRKGGDDEGGRLIIP